MDPRVVDPSVIVDLVGEAPAIVLDDISGDGGRTWQRLAMP